LVGRSEMKVGKFKCSELRPPRGKVWEYES